MRQVRRFDDRGSDPGRAQKGCDGAGVVIGRAAKHVRCQIRCCDSYTGGLHDRIQFGLWECCSGRARQRHNLLCNLLLFPFRSSCSLLQFRFDHWR